MYYHTEEDFAYYGCRTTGDFIAPDQLADRLNELTYSVYDMNYENYTVQRTKLSKVIIRDVNEA